MLLSLEMKDFTQSTPATVLGTCAVYQRLVHLVPLCHQAEVLKTVGEQYNLLTHITLGVIHHEERLLNLKTGSRDLHEESEISLVCCCLDFSLPGQLLARW